MTAPRSPDQRARFVRAAASDLDVAPELAEHLLFLSESARDHARTGALSDRTVRALLDCLLDDDVCRHAWWVAAGEGEDLWRLLVRTALPPRDVGPAVLLAVALARRGAAAEALEVIDAAVRPGEFRRSAIELFADLAEDAGQPGRAWTQVARLGLADPDAEWSALRCVLGCSRRRRCDRARLAGVTHARWLRHRIDRWSRRPWSAGVPDGSGPHPAIEGWTDLVAHYLAARAAVLPPGEQQLLARWQRIELTTVTVLASTRWEVAVLDPSGRRRHAGWESVAPASISAGDALRCRLLPTMLRAEDLVVRSTVPPTW